MRKSDRSAFDDLGRQAALGKVETKEIEKVITQYCESFTQDGNQRIHEKNEALHGKLEQLKNRFKT
jgi:nucleoid-associated protein YejK